MSSSASSSALPERISVCSVPGCGKLVRLYRENICGELEEKTEGGAGCGGLFCTLHLMAGDRDGAFEVALCVYCAPSESRTILQRLVAG